MNKKVPIWQYVFIGLILAFVYVPLIVMVVFSFNQLQSQTVFQGFTFKWYREIFVNRELSKALRNTVIVSFTAMVVSTILATLAAIAVSKQKKVFREIVLNANNIPILSPDILTAVAFLLFLIAINVEPNLGTMVLAHVTICTPYAFVTIYPKVRSLDPNIIEASADLGANPLKTLTKVIIPQLRGSIIAGAAIAFTMSFDDFIVSQLSSGGVQNISMYLYGLKKGIEPSVNALSTIIIAVIGIKIVYDLIKSRREKTGEED
ncbi:ABC transporter permease [Acholeplasma hippikon]|uniref:Polyamine (Spermidine/putrescine) ABC transporter permease n=1 Tax=Acholeplasma hippikon TaxID=264636 RepID=A0A449BID2_9MOLU|nr:ABC transporter permease [Acholeplasma hippikon]VEU82173.1 polyamine (spermidine/putrescine) ABC transporter permease [Acholeplasma hippikon]